MTPTIVYKLGGKHFGPKGSTYSYKGVDNETDLEHLLANGWFASLDEALNAQDNKPKASKKADAPIKKDIEPEVKAIQYKDLTDEDKANIKKLLDEGVRPSEIGKKIGLHHLSVVRVGKELSELD